MPRPVLVAAGGRALKRYACVKYIETQEDFRSATVSARAAGPDPHDGSISKRQWEQAVGRWRELMRSSAAQRGDDEVTGPIPPPPGLSHPKRGDREAGPFAIRLYTESDAALVV